jgi:hypothetical protein
MSTTRRPTRGVPLSPMGWGPSSWRPPWRPMDADFEDPEYQARCAEIDAYFAEKEREWRSKNGQ